jgi:hypothetical protein
MHEIFDEVVREISVRRVEMKMKAKFRVNLFQNENESAFELAFVLKYGTTTKSMF